MRRFLMLLPILACLALPSAARADRDLRRTLEFLGFSDDGARYLLKVSDANSGDALSVRSFATGKAEKTIPLADRATEKQTIDATKRKYRITDPGADAVQSPDGRYTLLVLPKGMRTEIRAMRGEKRAVLKSLDATPGPEGPPKVTLKSAFWTQDGRRVVVVLHRTLRGDDYIDADEAHPIDFLPGEMKFEGGGS